ncbi:MAG: hypothetical protein EXS13_12560 [Planctomycetes bacterium]|nr:hypothetical protein [Planctomycetota bacterium]
MRLRSGNSAAASRAIPRDGAHIRELASWAIAPLCTSMTAFIALVTAAGDARAQAPSPAPSPTASPSQDLADLRYTKLATRAATDAAVREQLLGVGVEWGPWASVGAFELTTARIAEPRSPEDELARFAANGPGPDRARDHTDKSGRLVRWAELPAAPGSGGRDSFGTIDLKQGLPAEQHDFACRYLHRTITCTAPRKLAIRVGSDDGLRLWCNRALVIDAAVVRGLDPAAHVLTLALERGVNHLLAKVSQDNGGFEFALSCDLDLPRAAQVALDWQLQHDFPEGESAHYAIASLPIPADVALEVGGLDLLPDGRPLVCTRRGDVFLIDGADELPPRPPTLTRFATGLHEPLGLAVRPDPRAKLGWCVVVAQRCELTRLVDLDGDLAADLHETVCDAWSISGNYHEYAFGPRYDPDGNAWVTLNLGHTGGDTTMGTTVPSRGTAVKIDAAGAMTIVADGLRSPDALNWLPGLGLAYTDNQGDYVATNKLSLVPPGSFHGHQSMLPFTRQHDGRAWKKGDPVPPRQEPAIWFPYGKLGQSVADFVVDDTGGKFGPFTGQLFVGDQMQAIVMRVAFDTITTTDGARVTQGACFPFLAGFKSGVHRLRFAADGSLWCGLTDRGWGSRGGWRDGLERVLFTGAAPFEIATIRATPGGFAVEFTAPIDVASATDPRSWSLTRWGYSYHPDYGSPEVGTTPLAVDRIERISERAVLLHVTGLEPRTVVEVSAPGVRSAGGSALLHPTGWYTLQELGSGE